MEDLATRLWDDLREQVAGILNLKTRGKSPAQQDLRQMRSYVWALVVLQNQVHGDVVDRLLENRLGAEPDARVRGQILKLFGELSAALP